jgi:hypothetical protein
MKGGAGNRPDNNDQERDDKRPRASQDIRGLSREDTEGVANPAKQIAVFLALSAAFFAAVAFVVSHAP